MATRTSVRLYGFLCNVITILINVWKTCHFPNFADW